MKEAKPFLVHILNSIEAIEGYVKNKDFSDFERDVGVQDQVMRRLEIIGEAVKNLPESLKSDYPEVEWKNAAAMRDMLIHQYFEVDLRIVWDTITIDLPKLKKDMEKILKESD